MHFVHFDAISDIAFFQIWEFFAVIGRVLEVYGSLLAATEINTCNIDAL